MKARICLTDQAINVLQRHQVNFEDYAPAYNGESAGLDLYNVGPNAKILAREKWCRSSEKPTLIPTGVRADIPNGYVGLILERGSIIKTGLTVRAGVIDPGFTGEIFVSFLNVGERDTIIETGAKMPVQLLVIPCASEFEVISKDNFEKHTKFSSRKEKMLGSTN